MLPDNTLSTVPLPSGRLEFPGELRRGALQDWALGGGFIGDAAHSHDHLWSAFLGPGRTLFVQRMDTPSAPVALTIVPAGVRWLSCAFDSNGRPVIAYQIGVDTYLYWYDSAIPGFTTTTFALGERPMLTFDDVRPQMNMTSDVILAYIKNGVLAYRQQRDRYNTEYSLGAAPSMRFARMGMGRHLRLEFIFTASGFYGTQQL